MTSADRGAGPGGGPEGRPPRDGAIRTPDPSLPPEVGWRGYLLIFGFWTLFGTLMAASLLLSSAGQTSPSLQLVAFTFGGAYTWAALTVPLFRLTRRFDLQGERRVRGFVALFAVGLVVALVVTSAVSGASYLGLSRLNQPFWTIFRYRLLTDLLGGLLVFTAGVARDYFFRYQARQQEAALLRAQLVETRLEVLRTQLNPHFLFNTLNAVAALVAKDPRGVRRMVARLSELLRYALQGSTEPEITLEHELEILRRYLEILEIRYQGRLHTSVVADPEVLNALVPNLILQPLAENAMKHGVGLAGGYGRVEVEARREGSEVVLSVRDTGAGSAAEPGEAGEAGEGAGGAGGFGLRHTRERLEQLYGGRYHLGLTPTSEGGTIAEIRLPYHVRPEERAPAGARPPEVRAHA